MSKVLKIKKCLKLNLKGGISEGAEPINIKVTKVAVTPDDFVGSVPKLEVKVGDSVEAGDPLWHDKANEDIKIVSPVKGRVAEIERGEKRKILKVVIEVSEEAGNGEKQPAVSDDEQAIKERIKSAGLWAMMRQLPYDIVPVDNRKPVNIFISAWDSAPLSAGYSHYLGKEENVRSLREGVKALKKLTTGNVYVGFRKGDTFPEIPGAETVEIEGEYPASLPSVLCANIAPVNKGETVWLLGAEIAVRIGQAVSGKKIDWTFPVAVVGSEVENPSLVNVVAGAPVSELIKSAGLREDDCNKRLISGNVLVGEKVGEDGYLRYPYRQLTAICEGDDKTEFMGWASVSPSKMSRSRSFPAFFLRKKKFEPDARLNGGRRAMIMSGVYDRYIPMDIMAEYLIKAILSRNIERMEELGIYEVTPGDFSAAEYADLSKLELQKIVREGLDYMIKEVGTGD